MPFLFSLLILMIVLGLCYWILTLLPIPDPFKQIVLVIFIVIVLLYVVSLLFGFAGPFPMFREPYYR